MYLIFSIDSLLEPTQKKYHTTYDVYSCSQGGSGSSVPSWSPPPPPSACRCHRSLPGCGSRRSQAGYGAQPWGLGLREVAAPATGSAHCVRCGGARGWEWMAARAPASGGVTSYGLPVRLCPSFLLRPSVAEPGFRSWVFHV